MELLVALIAGAIVAGFFYLLFILLFLIRLLRNRTLYSLALHFMRPVLRELYASDLAAAADKVLEAQPDEIHLDPAPGRGWKDAEKAALLLGQLKELGFSAAGLYAVRELPGVTLQLLTNGENGAGACVAEHPLGGLWLDLVFMYTAEKGVTVSSLRDPGLPARMRRPGSVAEYRPGADAAALYDRLMAARLPETPLPFTPANIAAKFEESWALDMDWRKQHQFTPEEARAIRNGKALPPEALKNGRLFDIVGGSLAIVNFAALVFFLFASRNYTPVGNGPWLEALKLAGIPVALFSLSFAFSIQASGPVMRSIGGVFMAIISLPFFWGTFFTGGIWLNCARDTGQAVVRRAEVTGKRETERRSHSYYASLRSWAPGKGIKQVRVTEEQYLGITPGRTMAVVTTKPGLLGHEWIAGLEFEPAGPVVP